MINIVLEFLIFLFSLGAVLVGADYLGSGAAKLAKKFSVPSIIIGATLLSLATTLPEITVSIFSSLNDESALGIGTVIGSPMVNIGLILGFLLIFSGVDVRKAVYTRTLQILIFTLLLVLVLLLQSPSQLLSGAILIIFGLSYLAFETLVGQKDEGFVERLLTNIWGVKNFFFEQKGLETLFSILLGASLLLIGGHFLVESISTLATLLNLPLIFVGIATVALATSLPETFSALNSVLKKRADLSAGNLVGASILNLTFALGMIHLFGDVQVNSLEITGTIGAIGLVALISLIPVYLKISPKLIGVLLISTYLCFIVFFGKVEI